MTASPLCIGLVGRLGTPQLACLRSWRRHGVRVVLLHTDHILLSPRVVRWLGVTCVPLGPVQADDAVWQSRLVDAVVAKGVTALTCVSDSVSVALWGLRPQLPPSVRILAARPAQILLLSSKAGQERAARRAGLPTLPSWLLQPGDALQVPDHVFPLVLRPDVQSAAPASFKVTTVSDKAALQRFLASLEADVGVVAQPLVCGPNLLVHGHRSPCGKQVGHVVFRAEVKHKGFTVVLRPTQVDPALLQACRRMEDALGLDGVFHYDFVQDARSGQIWFLDLNPRFGGSTGKVLAAGYDEPMALLAAMVPGVSDGSTSSLPLRISGGKHQALAALWSAWRGRSTPVDYPYPDRWRLTQALLMYLATGRDELLRLKALRSLLAFALHQIHKRRALR